MMMTRAEAARFLLEGNDFLILTHRRPDGDTLGSAAALCRGLRSVGKRAFILENTEVTPRYMFLMNALTLPAASDRHTLIAVDVAAPEMLPPAWKELSEKIALRIDHHATAKKFTRQELADAKAASCAEIIWDILKEMKIIPDREIAAAIYVGVSTDTGCFRFANTTDHSFRTAADCMSFGAPVHELNRQLFETHSLARLRMQGWMAEHAKFFSHGKMALCAIPKSVEAALGATEDDMDNISGFLKTIAGVCMAATLRQNEQNSTKVSIRAIPGYNAAAVCGCFGGGGHVGAAGASIQEPLEQAALSVEKAMENWENAQ